jgi:periplasmic divalent cation tolerance protein
MAPQIFVVQTTLPSTWIEPEVGAFAQSLLEAGAACIQHSSIRSTYRWEGKIESSEEWRLELKVSQEAVDGVLSALRKQHPYSTPQITYWKAESSQEYADWVDSA